MKPSIRSVSMDTRFALACSSILMRGRSSRAPASVAALAMRSARTSTVVPSVPSTSTVPFWLPICSSPPEASG